MKESSSGEGHDGLKKHLKVRDLTAFGIAAIIGAGIFSTIGEASYQAGPAVIFLFLFTAIACGFAAFAYAEFASIVPASGSAYTYSYVAFGEIVAWIIGWALIMEYAIGNITVAISWSDYFTDMLSHIHITALGIKGIHIPLWAQMDYLSALNGHAQALTLLESGKTLKELDQATLLAYEAYQNSPTLGGFHVTGCPAERGNHSAKGAGYRGCRAGRAGGNQRPCAGIAGHGGIRRRPCGNRRGADGTGPVAACSRCGGGLAPWRLRIPIRPVRPNCRGSDWSNSGRACRRASRRIFLARRPLN